MHLQHITTKDTSESTDSRPSILPRRLVAIMCNDRSWKSSSIVTIVFTSMLMLGMFIAIGVMNSMNRDNMPCSVDAANFNPAAIIPAIFTSLVMYVGSGLALKDVSHPTRPHRCLPSTRGLPL